MELRQGGQNYAYLYDGKGNVEAVLDNTQAVVAAYRYDPFGVLLNQTGSFEQPYGFSTKRYDAQIGMIQYEYRNYFPAIARWSTRDPLGEAGGMNLYAFVGNNPVNWVDPWGLKLRFSPGSTNAFKAQFAQAIQYLNAGNVSGIIAQLENLPQIVHVQEAPAGSNDMYYDSNTKTIVWDSLSALRCTNNTTQTPALGFLHEAGHALGDLTGNAASTAKIPGDPYDTAEERRVIVNIETPAAIKLGEGTRTDHWGTSYQTGSPISR